MNATSSPLRLALLLAAVVALGGATPSAGAANLDPEAWIEWEDGVVPVLMATLDPGTERVVGCAGTAIFTLVGGHRATLPAVALGRDDCASAAPPCAPYDRLPFLVRDCQANPVACCVYLEAPPVGWEVVEVPVSCMHTFWLNVSLDGDAEAEYRVGPFLALGDCDAPPAVTFG